MAAVEALFLLLQSFSSPLFTMSPPRPPSPFVWLALVVLCLCAPFVRLLAVASAEPTALSVNITTPTQSQPSSLPLPATAPYEEFDFVVVGGGSSGSVVAARLAQANYTVLLLEAGGPTQHSLRGTQLTLHPNLTLFDIPLYWTDITSNPLYAAEYEWPLYATPHPQVARGLGGCSVHNAMIYIRGLDRDFDDWGEEWSYETVMPFYRRSVSQQDEELRGSPLHADEYGGTGGSGEVHLSSVHPDDRDPISHQFIASCKEAGLEELRDFNGPHRREGTGYYQFLIREGQRETPASALYGVNSELDSAGGKLTIRTYAQVTRVNLERQRGSSGSGGASDANDTSATNDTASSLPFYSPSTPRAVSVSYVLLPQASTSSHSAAFSTLAGLPVHEAYARHEIILSAGAIGTPKLLMLSGIGAPSALAAVGIETIVELEGVGANAMDGSKVIMQWEAPTIYFNPCIPSEQSGGRLRGGKDELDERREKQYCDEARAHFFAAKMQLADLRSRNASLADSPVSPSISYGVMGTPGFSAGAFLKSHSSLERPNVQLTIFPWDKVQREWSELLTGIVTMEVATNNPISRGSVKLHSSDWYDPPVVDINYLHNSDDVEVLLWAIKRVRQIAAVGPLNATLVRELLPGPNRTDDELRDYILCGAKEFRGDHVVCNVDQRVLGHLAGTAQMGDPYVDALAVVDRHLRLIGVEGLRVADASIMPVLPSGNTHATCMMIGERAAELLIQAARGKEKGRGEEDEEEEEEQQREAGKDSTSQQGDQGVWTRMGGWRVLTIAVIFAALTSLGCYCLTVRRVGGRQAWREEEAQRPLLAQRHLGGPAVGGAASSISQ